MKTNRILVAAICGLLVALVAVSAYAYRTREIAIAAGAAASDKKRLENYTETFRWIVAKNAGIASGDSDLRIAEKLTDHLYQKTLFSGAWAPSNIEPQMYFLTIDQQTYNLCSSLSSTLDWMLGLFDIEARSVSFAAPNYFTEATGDTHVLVEALIDDRIVVFDPTFDTTYSCGSNEMIDAKQMVECASGQLGHRYIGKPRPGRSLAEYYVPITDMLHAIDATGGEDRFYQYELPRPGWLKELQTKYAAAAKK